MLFNRINTNLDVKFGFQKIKRGGLVLYFYTGLSIRTVQVRTNSELPVGGDFTDQGGVWTLRDNYNLTYPTPILGLKIGFTRQLIYNI
tara:strand:- start:576 stop:839 length:264 start_codon:yes stop_codon:yes gene_type:complete